MPTAARLALPVNVFVATMVDSFMMMLLLSLRFHFSIGMPHHPAFGKLLSCGSLPLIGAKFRYLNYRTHGVILMRLPNDLTSLEKADIMVDVISDKQEQLFHSFTVIALNK